MRPGQRREWQQATGVQVKREPRDPEKTVARRAMDVANGFPLEPAAEAASLQEWGEWVKQAW